MNMEELLAALKALIEEAEAEGRPLTEEEEERAADLTKRIEDLLSITKLLTVFETFDTEAEALQSFS